MWNPTTGLHHNVPAIGGTPCSASSPAARSPVCHGLAGLKRRSQFSSRSCGYEAAGCRKPEVLQDPARGRPSAGVTVRHTALTVRRALSDSSSEEPG